MTRLTSYELLLANLIQSLRSGDVGYMSREDAYARLKKETGQDFGFDVKAWRKWLRENTKR